MFKKYFWILAFLAQPVLAASTYNLESATGQISWDVNQGSSTEVYLRITNNDNVGIVETTITYDPNVFSTTVNDIQGLTNATTGENYAITQASVNNGQITFMVSTSAFTTGFPNNTQIAKITFTANQSATNSVIAPNSTAMTSLNGSVPVSPAPTGVTLNVVNPPPATTNPASGTPLSTNGNSTVTITNTGGAPLNLNAAVDNPDFIIGGTCLNNNPLPVGQSCTYQVSFNGNASANANLTITANGAPLATFPVAGVPVIAPPAGGATPVPTMSTWGLLIMSGLLGLFAVRRKA